MSIKVNGVEYDTESQVPDQYRMQSEMGSRQRDPGNYSPDLAPNVGRSIVPHITTFSGMLSTLARTYRQHDEAIRHNVQNANMMRRDPIIMGPLFARQMAVSLLQWRVIPEDQSDAKEVEVAQKLTYLMSRIPRFREYLRNLTEAIWYGRYACQNIWGFERDKAGRRYRTITDWIPCNGDKIVFRYDDGTGKYDPKEIGVKVSVAHIKDDIWAGKPDVEYNAEGTALFFRRWERSRFTLHKNFLMDGDYEDPTTAGMIHGVGLRHFLYWSWYQKQETLAQLAEVVERSGMGFTVYHYPAGNAQAKDEMERLAKEQAHKNQIVLPMEITNPDAYGIQQIPPNTQGIMALQSLIDDYFGSWIIKFILGQSLTYRAEAGTPGISDLHRDSFLQIVKYDSLGVEETVTRELLSMILAFNFPEMRNVNFKFKLNTEEAVPLEKLQALQAAWSMGAKIKSEDVMGLIGLNTAGETDDSLFNPQVTSALEQYKQMVEQGGDMTAFMPGPEMMQPSGGEVPAEAPEGEVSVEGGPSPELSPEEEQELSAMLGPIMQSKKYAKESGRAVTRRKAERLISHIKNQGVIPDVHVAQTGTHYITLSGPESQVKIRVADHADAHGTSDYTVDDIEGTYEGAKQLVSDWIAKERTESSDFAEELDDFNDRKSAFKKLKLEHAGLVEQIAEKHDGNIKTPDGEDWYPASMDLDKFSNADLHDPLLIDNMSEYVQRAKDTLGVEPDEYAKKSESGNYKPTKGMIGNAKRGLELRKKHEKGGTAVGVARARDIMNGKGLSFSTVKRMHSFFSRHAGNEEGGEDDAGYIAWLLWGGDSGRNWARSIVESKEKNSKEDVADKYAGPAAALAVPIATAVASALPAMLAGGQGGQAPKGKAEYLKYDADEQDATESSATVSSDGIIEDSELHDRMLNEFGTTDDHMETAFVMPDGQRIRGQATTKRRGQLSPFDHSAIERLYPPNSPDIGKVSKTGKTTANRKLKSVLHAVNSGAMFFSPKLDEDGHHQASISSSITPEQKRFLRGLIRKGHSVNLSVLDPSRKGRVVKDEETGEMKTIDAPLPVFERRASTAAEMNQVFKDAASYLPRVGESLDIDVPEDAPDTSTVKFMQARREVRSTHAPGRKQTMASTYDALVQDHGLRYDIGNEDHQQSLSDGLAHETIYALSRDGNAAEWYDKSLKQAVKNIAAIPGFEDVAKKGADQDIFKMFLALTSNMTDVPNNTSQAVDLFSHWKETGEINTEYAFKGQAKNAMSKHMVLLKDMLNHFGYEKDQGKAIRKMAKFMKEKVPVGSLKKYKYGSEVLNFNVIDSNENVVETFKSEKAAKKFIASNFKENPDYEIAESPTGERRGLTVSGEAMAEELPGAVIFGPKLGSFFNNLYGNFDTVTMDRWFMRTINRHAGTVTDTRPGAAKTQAARLLKELKAQDPQALSYDKMINPDTGENYGTPEQTHELLQQELERVIETGEVEEFGLLDQFNGLHYSKYSADGFKDRNDFKNANKQLFLNINSLNEAPGNSTARQHMRKIMQLTQEKVEQQTGVKLQPAAIQALLWYYEKDLMPQSGLVLSRQAGTDYARETRRIAEERAGVTPPTRKLWHSRSSDGERGSDGTQRVLGESLGGGVPDVEAEVAGTVEGDIEDVGQVIELLKQALPGIVRAAIEQSVQEQPERNQMGAGPRDHKPSDFDITNKQINGPATANRGTMPRQASSSTMPAKMPMPNMSTNPMSKTGMTMDATRIGGSTGMASSQADLRKQFMKYKKVDLIEKLRPFVEADPNFVLTDAQGKKRRSSLIKADKYSLANTLAEKYASTPIPGGDPFNPTGAMPGAPAPSQPTPQSSSQPTPQSTSQSSTQSSQTPPQSTPQQGQSSTQASSSPLGAGFDANVQRQQTGESEAEHVARALNHIDSIHEIDHPTHGSFSFAGDPFSVGDDSSFLDTLVVRHKDSQGNIKEISHDDFKSMVGDDDYIALGKRAIEADNQAWSDKARQIGIFNNADFVEMEHGRGNAFFTQQSKRDMNDLVTKMMHRVGKADGGIDLKDYSSVADQHEAGWKSFNKFAQKTDRYVQSAIDNGYKYDDNLTKNENTLEAAKHLGDIAKKKGFEPSPQKSAFENIKDAHQFLGESDKAMSKAFMGVGAMLLIAYMTAALRN